MGIRRKILKGVGYSVAPRLTFAALNPGKTAILEASHWVMDRVNPARRRRGRMRTTFTGLGAAAIAIPVGLWLGRRFWPSDASDYRIGDTA